MPSPTLNKNINLSRAGSTMNRWLNEPAKSIKRPIDNRAMWNGEKNKDITLEEQGIGNDILFLSLVGSIQNYNLMTVYTQKRLVPL